MSSDPSSIDSDLRKLRAAALDERLLARLDACAGETWTRLDATELAFERRLQGFAPSHLPPALMASLESAVSGVRFPAADVKIVRFPRQESSAPKRNYGWWSTAAAMALTGVVTALLVPTKPTNENFVGAAPKGSPTLPARPTEKLIPAGFNRGLSEASDEGVIWQSNNQPHRVLKVVYKDRMTLKNTNGRTYQVEQPRVEYILIPAKTD